jgi:alpha-L-rhamnosidase
MGISDLRINRIAKLENVCLTDLVFSFISDTEDANYSFILFDESGNKIFSQDLKEEDSLCFRPRFRFKKGKTYAWQVKSPKAASKVCCFKTEIDFKPTLLQAPKGLSNPVFFKEFALKGKVKKAELYVTGLGLYACLLNGQKAGDLYLTPGFNDYDDKVYFQAYDVIGLLKEKNQLRIIVGDGWYKGRIGFDNHPGEVWGADYLCAAILKIEYESGKKEDISTDSSWQVGPSPLVSSSIYDGQVIDLRRKDEFQPALISDKKLNFVLQDGAFVKKVGEFKPSLIVSPKGEKILDFGQNFAGYVKFKLNEKEGQEAVLRFGEVLQGGSFYNGNLRTAKAELRVISDGNEHEIHEYFTYYGFRYVLLEGFNNPRAEDFTAVVLSSCLDDSISFSCSDPEITQLVKNTFWGQKSNFVSIPTDCPQRDERMGWTADTQVFSNTAMMNADCFAFYKKFLEDLAFDQKQYYHGDIPAYSPSLKGSAMNGGAVWADAATIIPTNLYKFYKDPVLLAENFEMMEKYCGYLIKHDLETGNKHLVLDGFTFGDWLALDGAGAQAVKGGTDDNFIQSVYYWLSLELTGEAAAILHKRGKGFYLSQAKKIKKAILHEYFSPSGRLSIDTQTGYVLALTYGLYISKEKLIEGFKKRLAKDGGTLKTGFAGTPLLLNALFMAGLDEQAFAILFNEDFPGWKYQIKLGATTVWERWNSLLPDGTISGTGMNSLNHYANGSVCYSIYSCLAGLTNASYGFKTVRIEPHLNYRLKNLAFSFASPVGLYKISYKISKDQTVVFIIRIPQGCNAVVKLPEQEERSLKGGDYSFSYKLTEDFYHPFSLKTPLSHLMKNGKTKEALTVIPFLMGISSNPEFGSMSIEQLASAHIFPLDEEKIKQVGEALAKIEIL